MIIIMHILEHIYRMDILSRDDMINQLREIQGITWDRMETVMWYREHILVHVRYTHTQYNEDMIYHESPMFLTIITQLSLRFLGRWSSMVSHDGWHGVWFMKTHNGGYPNKRATLHTHARNMQWSGIGGIWRHTLYNKLCRISIYISICTDKLMHVYILKNIECTGFIALIHVWV